MVLILVKAATANVPSCPIITSKTVIAATATIDDTPKRISALSSRIFSCNRDHVLIRYICVFPRKRGFDSLPDA